MRNAPEVLAKKSVFSEWMECWSACVVLVLIKDRERRDSKLWGLIDFRKEPLESEHDFYGRTQNVLDCLSNNVYP
jgi:hypothetical protein